MKTVTDVPVKAGEELDSVGTIRVARVLRIDSADQLWLEADDGVTISRPARRIVDGGWARLHEGDQVAYALLQDGTPIAFGVITEKAEAGNGLALHSPRPGMIDAIVDDDRIVIEAHREIVLRCGRSSITLRRDGKIVVHGVDILSRAVRLNRIKGGVVNIN